MKMAAVEKVEGHSPKKELVAYMAKHDRNQLLEFATFLEQRNVLRSHFTNEHLIDAFLDNR